MGYTFIMIISLLKWVDALVLLSAMYSIPGTAKKIDILITIYFSFDQVSLKSDVKFAVFFFFFFFFFFFNVRVILIWRDPV